MDLYYLIFVIPAVILSLYAQIKVKSTFSKYSKVASEKNLTGAQAASFLLKANSITDVTIEKIAGNLTDHYSPNEKVLRLSESVYGKNSIAAVGVAAHETGHAIQHATKYGPLGLRSSLVPIANIGSRLGPVLVMAGFGLFAGSQSNSALGQMIVNVGLLLFAGSVAFYLVTLPVEFNASNRAMKILKDANALSDEELQYVKKVLSAAAMTYVASALTAVGNFLRIFLISRNRRKS
ncbi:MAG: zinc metallopeptidase [Treponema sp.]|nr:zinc metallopeptidase [Treponema sp.]